MLIAFGNEHLKDMLQILSTWRASVKAVTSKQYIRATSPVNTYSSGVKTDFRRKTGRSPAVYESIGKIPAGKTIRFSSVNGPFGSFQPFLGPNGTKIERPLFKDHLDGVMRRLTRVHPGDPFSILLLEFKSEMRSGKWSEPTGNSVSCERKELPLVVK